MGKKCQKSGCGWDGNDPEWEFCGHCGEPMDEIIPASSSPKPPIFATGKSAEQSPPVMVKPQPSPPSIAYKTTAKLVIIKSGRIGQEFPMTNDSVNIGRWDADGGSFPEVDLSQDDPENYVSRRHARIAISNGRYYIEDLGSSNGTFLNKGPRLVPGKSLELKDGDEIVIGKTFLNFVK